MPRASSFRRSGNPLLPNRLYLTRRKKEPQPDRLEQEKGWENNASSAKGNDFSKEKRACSQKIAGSSPPETAEESLQAEEPKGSI